MGYYESNQNIAKESGAYVFSPKSETPILPELEECFIFQEKEWLELHAFYQPGFGYVARKSLKQPYWEIEWFVQPIDVSDRCVYFSFKCIWYADSREVKIQTLHVFKTRFGFLKSLLRPFPL